MKDIKYNIVDSKLEITDPVPNIYDLFRNFNYMFFENKLASVAVDWSKSMKSSAGVCSYQSKSKFCQILLSESLLKLRSRKDLVETLLHEMIHAFLFISENDTDRDGHGPNFRRIMKTINEMTGANITVYHDFHDEVHYYKSNWFRCNGPCRNRKPLFGFVKGKRDRGPCNKDRWYAMHKATCGGRFLKSLVAPSKSLINKENKLINIEPKSSTLQTTLMSDNGKLTLSKDGNKENYLPTKVSTNEGRNGRKIVKPKTKAPFTEKALIDNKYFPKTNNKELITNVPKKLPSIVGKRSTNDTIAFSGKGIVLGGSVNTITQLDIQDQLLNNTSKKPKMDMIPLSSKGNLVDSVNTERNVAADITKLSNPSIPHNNSKTQKNGVLKKGTGHILGSGISNSTKTKNVSNSISIDIVWTNPTPDISELIDTNISYNFPSQNSLPINQIEEMTDLEKVIQMSLEDLEKEKDNKTRLTLEITTTYVECPSCPDMFLISEINDHLNMCLS